MTEGVNIRRATEADLALMQELWNEFNAEATYTPYPPAPFEPALVRDHVALVAEEDGEVVGTAYTNLSSPDFGYVFGVYTRPHVRSRGVGRALMRAIAEILRDEGRTYVVLSVDGPNHGARAFYEGLGFEEASHTLRTPVNRLLAD